MIFLILLIGIFLRFLGVVNAGFHHDELSALLRTRFDDWDTLIQQGVRVDGHPAFTQVFLWLWYDWVGAEAWAIKLPFLFAGCFSIFALYRIASMLFSKPVGLLAASGFAVMQYGITYAQWARPYAFGMLAVLLVVWAMLTYQRSGKWQALMLFALAAAWSAYTHYFALLQVLLFTLLWFIMMLNKRQRFEVVIAALIGLLLWLPHLNITLHHLRIGGIGDWLALPTLGLGFDLMAYTMHYSWWLATPFLLGVMLFLIKLPENRIHWKTLFLLAGLVVFPFAIAFCYSHWRSALLHVGSMAFAFPFFVLFLSGLFYHSNRSLIKVITVWILLFGSLTLFKERFHPSLNLQTEFSDPIQWYHRLKPDFAKQGLKLSAYFDLRQDAVAWLDSNGVDDFSEVVLFEALRKGKWADALSSSDADALLLVVTAASEPEFLAHAQTIFPFIEEIHHYNAASCYLLSRANDRLNQEVLLQVDHPLANLEGNEYVHKLTVGDSLQSPFTYLIATAVFKQIDSPDLKLVLDGETNTGRYWRAVDATPFISGATGPLTRVYNALDLRDKFELGELWSLNLYPWNPAQADGWIQSLSIRLIPSNPVRYALFEPIPDKTLVRKEGRILKSLLNLEHQN